MSDGTSSRRSSIARAELRSRSPTIEHTWSAEDIRVAGHPLRDTFLTRVVLATAGVDADAQFNLRLRLTVHDVEAEEFNIRVHTWGDSIIYNVWVAWTAFDAKLSQ